MKLAKARTIILWAFVLALAAAPAAADTFVCEDDFCVFGSTDVLDNVVVRSGGILLLDGTVVTGNVHVEEGGILAASRTLIAGNVRAHEAFLIDLVLTAVEGNVQIKRTGGVDPVFGLLPSADLLSCEVGGNVQIIDNEVNFLTLLANDIDGNLQLKRNVSRLPIRVDENFITGNLQCQDNDPPPSGSGNVVEGNVQGQCEGLGF